MSKALLEVNDYTFHTYNILDHTDKLIVKVINFDIIYDSLNNTIVTYHNSTL